MTGGRGDGYEWDFFISYTEADRAWAEWLAWQLDAARHRVLLQAWDIVAGMHRPERLTAGMARSARTLAVLSPDYLASEECKAEWLAAWDSDRLGHRRRLLPVRVMECEPQPPLKGVVGEDLFGVGEEEAAARLARMVAAAVSGEDRPAGPPLFSGDTAGDGRPRFPGAGPGLRLPHPPTAAGRRSRAHLVFPDDLLGKNEQCNKRRRRSFSISTP